MSRLYGLLEAIGLEPEDKGLYFLVRCPNCGRKEMFLYKTSKKLICNRRNKCGHETTLRDILKERGYDRNFIIENFFEKEKENIIQEKVKKELEIPEGLTFFKDLNSGMIRDRAFNYLKERRIQEKYVYQLGYIFNTNSFYNFTIFIPFYEKQELVYYTCRDFTNSRYKINEDGSKDKIRYLAAKGINSHDYVFNYDNILEGEDLFIFEGLFCAMSLKDQIGTATLTDKIGDVQAVKIWEKNPGRIILVPDNDEAGRKTIMRNYKKLLYHRPPSMEDVEIMVHYLNEVKDFNETEKYKIEESQIQRIKKINLDHLFF